MNYCPTIHPTLAAAIQDLSEHSKRHAFNESITHYLKNLLFKKPNFQPLFEFLKLHHLTVTGIYTRVHLHQVKRSNIVYSELISDQLKPIDLSNQSESEITEFLNKQVSGIYNRFNILELFCSYTNNRYYVVVLINPSIQTNCKTIYNPFIK